MPPGSVPPVSTRPDDERALGNGGAFPELEAERRHLQRSRRHRQRMIDELRAVDPSATADEFTGEYVEMTVADALESLQGPGAGDFFGRIDTDDSDAVGDSGRWYIGRRHIENAERDPLVVDWRAPIAAGFYRATAADRLDVTRRRRFSLTDGELTAYLDEQLDDPDAADVAGGIPDPVLAEIGAERTGAMREIVATIQGEQDVVIRAGGDQLLVVQGGPGTGKTAVALHRAAFLMFEHRQRMARDGVLVIGPNRAFLEYIAHVLPSLGERSVRQCTVAELCIPKVEITVDDPPEIAARKGSVAVLDRLAAAALEAITVPAEGASVPFGVRRIRFTSDELAEWLARATAAVIPVNERRQRLRAIAQQELRRKTGGDEAWRHAAELKAVLNAAWPQQQPKRLAQRVIDEIGGRPGGRRRFSVADQLLVDEANSILNGVAQRFGHVLVDEAQDHSAVALRVIGRRSLDGVTLVGDLAQSTTPAGQRSWTDVVALFDAGRTRPRVAEFAELTIGYRVPEPILRRANELLPATGVDVAPSRSVRLSGREPEFVVADGDLGAAVADTVVRLRHRHRLTGVVALPERHAEIAAALAGAGLAAADHVHELAGDEIPLFGPEQVKGLEFDGVVVVDPEAIRAGTERGARLLYVAMTRAVQELAVVSARSGLTREGG